MATNTNGIINGTKKLKSALIFGASGVTGWSFVNELLNDYPKKGVWGKVHALTNRTLAPEDTLWPNDERLNIVSGIDLLQGTQEELTQAVGAIDGVKNVTHVYYLAYKANTDHVQEYKDAEAMFRRSITAIDALSPNLEFVVLQTGAKMYGCHLLTAHPTDYISVPLHESLPRLRGSFGDGLFYHAQLDWVSSFAANKSWNWIDTRPDIIIGFVPNQNFYSLASSVGVFCSLWKEVHGEGAVCPYPGSWEAWRAKSNDSSSDMIARQTIHLSLTLPTSRKGEGFNVADEKNYRTWETKWPDICAWFGLKGVEPLEEGKGRVEVRTWIKEHMNEWRVLERREGLKSGRADSDLTFKGFEYFLLTQFDFDRQYDMKKMYETGFSEERDTKTSWGGVFDRMRAAKIIP